MTIPATAPEDPPVGIFGKERLELAEPRHMVTHIFDLERALHLHQHDVTGIDHEQIDLHHPAAVPRSRSLVNAMDGDAAFGEQRLAGRSDDSLDEPAPLAR